jgi:uncharacterized protein YjbJ (UPF0337 family)
MGRAGLSDTIAGRGPCDPLRTIRCAGTKPALSHHRCRGHDGDDGRSGQRQPYPRLLTLALMQVSAARAALGEDVSYAAACGPDSADCVRRPHPAEGARTMDKERIKGTAKQAGGTVKEQAGKLTGNTSLEAEGKIEKVEGTLRKTFGKVKDALRKG